MPVNRVCGCGVIEESDLSPTHKSQVHPVTMVPFLHWSTDEGSSDAL